MNVRPHPSQKAFDNEINGPMKDENRPFPNNRLIQGSFSTCSEYLRRCLLVLLLGALAILLLVGRFPYSAIPSSWFPDATPWHHHPSHHRPWIKLQSLVIRWNSSGNRRLQLEEDTLLNKKRHYPPFPPVVDCAQWMARADNGTTNHNGNKMGWTDPYQGKTMIPYTLPEPAPSNLQIGLFGKEVSFVTLEVQSKASRVRHAGQYIFLNILKRYNNNKIDTTATQPGAAAAVPMVLQVGGQIGWFSLQAAALGFDVHVLEANPSHVLRMCRNIQLNHQEANGDIAAATSTFTTNRPLVLHLYHAAVVAASDGTSIPSTTTLSTHVDLSGRLGRGVFAHQIEFVPAFLKPLYPRHQQLLPFPSTTLDHWTKSQSFLDPESNTPNTNIVLLKIDVAPGHETQVLRSAQRLLQSKHVWNIMVDIKAKSLEHRPHEDDEEDENNSRQEGSSHRPLVQLLLDSGYQFYNQWDKTKNKATFQDGNDDSFVPKVAFNNNNNNPNDDDATKKAVVDSIVNLMHQFCTQGVKGCHMWWKRGTVDSGP
jgi:hypothetical protein